VIPNGASEQSSREYSQEELNALKKKLNKKEGDIYLLSIGRLVYQKSIDTVIKALARLPSHIQLIVVGVGPDKDKLVQLAGELNLNARVHFIGQVNRDETAKYRKVCDIFVLPSRSEGQGISLVSSMLSGLPIIATQEGGIADFLFDARRDPGKLTTGWVVDKENPEQIAEAVQHILAHPKEVQRVVENAQQLARKNYNWKTIASEMHEKVFDKLFVK
jgi:glycosyltransferase involved in cell wall biosynthesis